MKTHAQAVIIGGGVAGCSIAYHLTLLGWRDIVLVEKGELTGGSTFHAAGLVGQLRSSASLTRMMVYGADLYHRLKEETGLDPAFHQVGSLRLASSKARMDELRRQVAFAKTVGLQAELIGPKEACDLFPPMAPDGMEGAVWLPTDGHIDPSGLAQALARGARSRGAELHVETSVQSITVENGRVRGVVTDKGAIQSDCVVIAGGAWSPLLARLAGVNIPLMPFAHQYVVTRPVKGVGRNLPTMRDPDKLVYFKEELGGFVMGGYERDPVHYDYDNIPADFNHQLLDPDWDRFMSLFDAAVERVPSFAEAEPVKLINGFEAFTPDGEFIMGETPEVRGLWVACGFCAHGIAGGGGVGKVMAEWIVEGQPFVDMAKMDVRRFAPQYRSKQLTLAQTHEVYATYYDIHLPMEERAAVRELRLSPLYGRLKQLGATFGEKAGWERPNYFAGVAAEHQATRERAGLFDFSSFSKIQAQGAGALAFLQRITCNEMDRPVGSITYTQMLNPRGGIECDLTVTRMAADRFYIITGTAFGPHDLAHMRRHAPDPGLPFDKLTNRGDEGDGSVYLDDVTSSRAVIGLWGPRARSILQSVTSDDLSNAAAPYLSARWITVGRAPVLALRVTYVGELGWELHTPTEYGLHLWDTLWDAGQPFGVAACGYYCVDTLRFEKGYRYWSTELTPEYTPYEAGLGFCVKLSKGDFIGRAALLAQKERGLSRKLCCLVLDDGAPIVWGREPILAGETAIGRVTGGNLGHTIGRVIVYGYLPLERAIVGARYAVEIAGELWGATVAAEPLWDSKNERIKA